MRVSVSSASGRGAGTTEYISFRCPATAPAAAPADRPWGGGAAARPPEA